MLLHINNDPDQTAGNIYSVQRKTDSLSITRNTAPTLESNPVVPADNLIHIFRHADSSPYI